MKKILYSIISLTGIAGCNTTEDKTEPTNILLITVDDMNYNSVGVYGCKTPNSTPNIDRLASEGIRFTNAHVVVSVSQPSRNSIATGMYPHNSKLEGFYGFSDSTSITLVYEILQNNGFLTGILGKVGHCTPKTDFKWNYIKEQEELGYGRDPEKYYNFAKEFFSKAKRLKKPFYFMANSHDPHRPFYGSQQEKEAWPGVKTTQPSKVYSHSEVIVPGFLPDIPDVRLETSEYFSSVKRADDCVGKILQALDESGMSENTMVIFLSDNGAAFPFSKTNCYLNSTKTPMIVRWPNKIFTNSIDTTHFVSTIDLMPTILELNNIEIPENVDGSSLMPVLLGNNISGRDMVFTQFFETSARNRYPMRCVQNKRFGYIFNLWANGKRTFKNESQVGRTFAAMRESAKKDQAMTARVDYFLHRTMEEFYDFKSDPDALRNLIDDPNYKDEIDTLRKAMEDWMRANGDSALHAFINRSNPEVANEFTEKQQRAAVERKRNHVHE